MHIVIKRYRVVLELDECEVMALYDSIADTIENKLSRNLPVVDYRPDSGNNVKVLSVREYAGVLELKKETCQLIGEINKFKKIFAR